MTALDEAAHVDLPFVRTDRVRALAIEPLVPEKATWMVLDGEEVPMAPAYLEVGPSLSLTNTHTHTHTYARARIVAYTRTHTHTHAHS